MKKVMQLIVCQVILLCGFAHAAQPPSLIGTWEATSGYWVYSGTASNPAPTEFSQKPLHAKMIITEQKDNTFSGSMLRYDDQIRNIVGVISPDGNTVLFSIDNGAESGVLSKNKTEFSGCGTTVRADHNRAYCTVFKKVN
jgi:hypothetical protein